MSPSRRFIDFLTQPPRSPVRQLSLYYLAVAVLGIVLVAYLPAVGRLITALPLRELGSLTGFGVAHPAAESYLDFTLEMVIVMAGTLVLAIPVAWSYMAIRERSGFDQSVAQTLVILPAVVAAIMMIVQHSLALAFALAGVAAAVRFRNTLKDVADATYVFVALGVGIAAGVGALTAAAVMSMIFTFVSVALWRCSFGDCRTPAVAPPGIPQNGTRRGLLAVRVRSAEGRTAVEDFLGDRVKQWKLDRVDQDSNDRTTLAYRVRLKKSVPVGTIVDGLRGRGDGAVEDAVFTPRKHPT